MSENFLILESIGIQIAYFACSRKIPEIYLFCSRKLQQKKLHTNLEVKISLTIRESLSNRIIGDVLRKYSF